MTFYIAPFSIIIIFILFCLLPHPVWALPAGVGRVLLGRVGSRLRHNSSGLRLWLWVRVGRVVRGGVWGGVARPRPRPVSRPAVAPCARYGAAAGRGVLARNRAAAIAAVLKQLLSTCL